MPKGMKMSSKLYNLPHWKELVGPMHALGQLVGVVAIATDSRGYSDVQGFRHGYSNG